MSMPSQKLLPCPFCGGPACWDDVGAHCASIDCRGHIIKGFTAEEWNARPAPAASAPEGWKLVPVEPTKAMLDAGRWEEFGEESSHLYPVDDIAVGGVWECMVKAAPSAPSVAHEFAPRDKYGDRVCPFCGCHTNASHLSCCEKAEKAQKPVAHEAGAQGGGVDVEKVMGLVEEYGLLNRRIQAATFNSVRSLREDDADEVRAQIRALLSAPPAASGWQPVFEVGTGWLTTEHQRCGTLLYVPAIANKEPKCWCATCRPVNPMIPEDNLMIVCPICGNKRCPRASNHNYMCSGSNEPGQTGVWLTNQSPDDSRGSE